MKGSGSKKRGPKWHLVYYVLAAFDLLTISGSLLLNHEIMRVYTGSVELNKELSDIQGRFIELGRLASRVNAPGNDVFDSNDVEIEVARRKLALARFEQSLAILRREVGERLNALEAPPLNGRLDEIEIAMAAMIEESDRIFQLFREDRREEAGHRMATMDRTYARVTTSVADASSLVRGLQSQRFTEQLAAASTLRRFEYLIGAVIAVMVCLVAVYGHAISRRVKQVHAEALNTRLGRIVEESINEIYVFDAVSFHYLQVNRGARENLGYSMDELFGMTPLDLKPDMDREDLEKLLAPLRSGALDQVVLETVHRRKDGSVYDVEVHLQFARQETPQVFVAIAQDITELRANEEQLLQAQKMNAVGQLTGGVAHDFNNLLTEITGNLELLESTAGTPEARALIAETQEAAGLGAKLTRDLLAFARRQKLAPEAFDLNGLLLSMSDWLRRTLGEGIRVETSLSDDIDPVMADPGKLKNAVLNLALNARDAMPEGGRLTIATAMAPAGFSPEDQDDITGGNGGAPDRFVMLSVTDSGVGMPAEIRDRAFEPFYTTKEVGAGTGLGLSMVYGFARQSGGHAELLSKPGMGTSVRLYLPVADAEAVAAAAGRAQSQAASTAPGRGETVLLVEDNPRVRRVTMRRLAELGFKVIEAEDGNHALEIIDTQPTIDLLLTDVMMPGGMTGGELARAAQRRRPGLKVLFTSGFASADAASQGLVQDGAPLLAKPYSRDELIRSVRTALDG